MSEETLLDGFEIIELEDVQREEEQKNTNEIELACGKLAKKVKKLKAKQVELKLEREQIKQGLDELKRKEEEKRRRETEKEERSKKLIEAKLAKFEDYEKARHAEFEKYLKRYKERSESGAKSSGASQKIRKAQSERK